MGDSRHWFADALLGLEYLHFQGVAHFDLKPDNILIGPDNNAVLADFGVTAGLKWPQPCLTTPPHRPPWTICRLRPRLRPPERRLRRVEARRGPDSSPQAAPKLRILPLSTARRCECTSRW